MILAHNLVLAIPIKETEEGFTLSSTLYENIAMSPDIARLVHDTFYRENLFELNRPTNNQIQLLSISVRPLIKRFTLNMCEGLCAGRIEALNCCCIV